MVGGQRREERLEEVYGNYQEEKNFASMGVFCVHL
jgi:hypothetical protein